MDDRATQFDIDFRTGRPTAIRGGGGLAQQRAACLALNRQRTRGLLEAAQATSPSQSVSVDVWSAPFVRRAKQWDVPLIPLAKLGIAHDRDGLRESTFLKPLTSGAEACPYWDREWDVVYKLFDLRENGALGKKLLLEPNYERDGDFEVEVRDAVLTDTLEKLSLLNEAGGHPTEIIGLSEDGDYLIAKQPLARPIREEDFHADREAAMLAMKCVAPTGAGFRQYVGVIWLHDRAWLVGDLHQRNIMQDSEGKPTIMDALIGSISPMARHALPALERAIQDARAIREGNSVRPRRRFEDVEDAAL